MSDGGCATSVAPSSTRDGPSIRPWASARALATTTRGVATCSDAVSALAKEFACVEVYLAGGNARRISGDLFAGQPFEIEIAGNEASLRGAARLFR